MDIQTVTDSDIQADPLAVLDLCVGVLEKSDKLTVGQFHMQIGDLFDRYLSARLVKSALTSNDTKQDRERIARMVANSFFEKTIDEMYSGKTTPRQAMDVIFEKVLFEEKDAANVQSGQVNLNAYLAKTSGIKTGSTLRTVINYEDFGIQPRYLFIEKALADGWIPEKEDSQKTVYVMRKNGFVRNLTKTEYDYALFLQNKDTSAFDSIGSELDAITDQDIESDPLAVLDLCVGLLEESTDAITPTGRANPVKTAKGTKVGTQFAVVEVEKLITSHDSAGNENPAFPQELQPRDRGRDASRAWVAKTANSLDHDSLGRTSRADSGAPIVGRDGIVESGNGRTMAIRMAYDQGTADEYREFLISDADYFGIDPDQVERMKRPVLVRVRTTEIDRRVFTVEANQDDKLALSATERARSDSKRLDANMLALFKPDENGSLLTLSNHKFIQAFLASLGDAEAAQYVTKGGKPTRALVDRIRAAVFSKAYNDDRLLEMMADDANPDLQNVLNALGAASSKFIEAQAFGRAAVEDTATAMVDGIEQSLDERVTNAVIEATNTLLSARANNQDVTEYVRQQGLFEDIDDGVAALAVFLAQNSRSAKRMAIAFKAMAEYVKNDAINQTNNGLFGEPVPPSLIDVVAAANIQLEQEYGGDARGIGLFDSYLADGRYDHIHLDDLQMHPYANAAKERQPTANTPLLVQKNRRGDLYLIAGVKRYEMALDDDVEHLPAVILPVIEGYGDPVIKRVLNAYTGSIDPLALMAAIEDAVVARAGKKVMFDGLGGDISTITDLDIQNDPLGVLEACLVALDGLEKPDMQNPEAVLRHIGKLFDGLGGASPLHQSQTMAYYNQLKDIVVGIGYKAPVDFASLDRRLFSESTITKGSQEMNEITYDEYKKGGEIINDIAYAAYSDAVSYDDAIKAAIKSANERTNHEWKLHKSRKEMYLRQAINADANSPEIIEMAMAEYSKLNKVTWAKFVTSFEDELRQEKDRIGEQLAAHGRKVIALLEDSTPIDTATATSWADRQVITSEAVKKLKKLKYPVADVRKDLAEVYRLTGGRISHVKIDHLVGNKRAFTTGSNQSLGEKTVYLDGDFDRRTLFHEIGHHMESDAGAKAAAHGFLAAKRESTRLYSLRSLSGNQQYKPAETAFKGDFFDPYVGKYYKSGITEVWSMGVESLANPAVLAQRMVADPAMFAMIVGGFSAPKHPLAEVSEDAVQFFLAKDGIEKAEKEMRIKELFSLVLSKVVLVQDQEAAEAGYARGRINSNKYQYVGSYRKCSLYSGNVMNAKSGREVKGFLIANPLFEWDHQVVSVLPTDDLNMAKVLLADFCLTKSDRQILYGLDVDRMETLNRMMEGL